MKKLLLILCLTSMTTFGGLITDYKLEVAQIEKNYESEIERDCGSINMSKAKQEMYNAYDFLLNKYYKELMEILTFEQQKSLRKSQREWIKYREKELDFLGELNKNKNGTIWDNIYWDRSIKLLKDRVDELVLYLEWEKEGIE